LGKLRPTPSQKGKGGGGQGAHIRATGRTLKKRARSQIKKGQLTLCRGANERGIAIRKQRGGGVREGRGIVACQEGKKRTRKKQDPPRSGQKKRLCLVRGKRPYKKKNEGPTRLPLDNRPSVSSLGAQKRKRRPGSHALVANVQEKKTDKKL